MITTRLMYSLAMNKREEQPAPWYRLQATDSGVMRAGLRGREHELANDQEWDCRYRIAEARPRVAWQTGLLDQPVLEGVFNGLRAIADLQLVVHR